MEDEDERVDWQITCMETEMRACEGLWEGARDWLQPSQSHFYPRVLITDRISAGRPIHCTPLRLQGARDRIFSST